MRVIVLSGFLGSGKTSVLLQLARRLTEDVQSNEGTDGAVRLAIIENEVGDVGVDDKIIGGGYEVTNLFSGCVCCTLLGEVAFSLNQLASEMNPDYVIIEPSGVASPDSLVDVARMQLGMPCRVVSIADAQRWARIKRAMANLLDHQLKPAQAILLNKIDTVEADTVDQIEQDIRAINASAPIFRISANQPIDAAVLDGVFGLKEDW